VSTGPLAVGQSVVRMWFTTAAAVVNHIRTTD